MLFLYFPIANTQELSENNSDSISKDKLSFWNHPKRGANIFNQFIIPADIKAAREYGLDFIRLAPDKFPSEERDFLIGDADNFFQIQSKDLLYLKKVLDLCAHEEIGVVLTMLSLPGSRWKQNNNNEDDLRLWNDELFQKQAAQFWQEIALQLHDHPAIVGYDILNEPHPERLYEPEIDPVEIQKKLFEFYNLIIDAIREVDPTTPIILESSCYADPKTFMHLKIHEDKATLYSFHMYEPFHFTNKKMNQGRFFYPGTIINTYWDKENLTRYLQAVTSFQHINALPSHRILVGEFGGHRTSPGLANYFSDLLDIFEKNRWHYAFYAFREDSWDGMDYELGTQELPANFWQRENGDTQLKERNADCLPFKILKDNLNKNL